MIADQSLRLPLGSRIRLGKDSYEVVGLTRGMVGSSGDGLTFFTVSDAMAIQFDEPGEAVRLERAARRGRLIGARNSDGMKSWSNRRWANREDLVNVACGTRECLQRARVAEGPEVR